MFAHLSEKIMRSPACVHAVQPVNNNNLPVSERV